MLTDAGAAVAHADYEAISGTPPDCYSSLERDSFLMSAKVQRSIDARRKEGMTWFRVTVEPQFIWVEGWKVRPLKESPFNPPDTTLRQVSGSES